MSKPRLLILWGSPYTFCDALAPQLPALAQRFEIILAMTDHNLQEAARAQASAYREEGVLWEFFTLPVWSRPMLGRHRVMAQLVPLLGRVRIDAFMSVSTALAYERYITELICPKAFRILYWPHLCNQHLDAELSDALQREGPLPRAAMRMFEAEPKPHFKLFDRYIFPLLQVGRCFPQGRFDAFSQIGSEFDLMLLHSEADARDFRRIYGRGGIAAVAYPRTPAPASRINTVLMPFSLHAPWQCEALLPLYVRELRTVLRASGAVEIHMRQHPGRYDLWLAAFVAKLRTEGVPIYLSPSADPLNTQAQQYRGVVGAASAALRDTRLGCKDLFVVGLESLSQDYTPRAKRLVGAGVDWIEADGSYDPAIFKPRTVTSDLPEAAEVIIEAYERERA